MTPETVKFNRVILLFLLAPVDAVVTFLVNQFLEGKGIDVGSYVHLTAFLVLLAITKTDRKFILFLLVYFALYSTLFHGALNNNAREVVTFVLACAALDFFSRHEIETDELQKYDRFFLYFAYSFALMYLISVYAFKGITLQRTTESITTRREWSNGFIIGHAYAYYAVVLGYYLMRRYSLAVALPIFLSSLVSGTRTGLVILFGTLLIHIVQKQKRLLPILSRLAVFLCVVFLVITILRQFIAPLDSALATFENSRLTAFSLYRPDSQTIEFTAGRLVLWTAAFADMRQSGLASRETILGRGPMAAQEANLRKFHNGLWMHNDFIQIVYCFGLLGLALYLFSLSKIVHFRNILVLYFLILSAASINGFYKYAALQIIIVFAVLHRAEVSTDQDSLLTAAPA